MMATKNRQVVIGLRELGQAFEKLVGEMQTKIARRATNAGAQVIKRAVHDAAMQQPTLADKPFVHDGVTYMPGEIARNVIVKRIKDPDVTSEHLVAVRSNSKNGFIGRIGSLNEFGTVKMSKQPFMGPGFESSKQDANEAIVKTLDAGIQSAVRKNAKAVRK